MDKLRMRFLKVLCIFTALIQYSIWCREYDECDGINEPDAVVASKKSCAKYVFCDGENSHEAECLAGNYFNEDTGSCDDSRNVECNIEPADDVKSIYDEDFITTENIDETTQAEEDDSEENTMDIEENEVVASSTDAAVQVNDSKCPQLNGFHNIIHIANPESCVAFYKCYNGRAIPMLCPGKMYFNDKSGRCEPQMPESCKINYTVRLNCRKGVYDFVPHPYRCEYYFYCLNGYLMIMRCPNDFTWHFQRGTCVQKSKSKCYVEKSVISRNDY